MRPPRDFARALRRRMGVGGWPRDVPASVPDAPDRLGRRATRFRRRRRAEGGHDVVVLVARRAPRGARDAGAPQGAALLRPLLGPAVRGGRRAPIPLVLLPPGGRRGRRVDAALHGRLLDPGAAPRIRTRHQDARDPARSVRPLLFRRRPTICQRRAPHHPIVTELGVRKSTYRQQLRRMLDALRPRRRCCAPVRTLPADPRGELRRTLDFLGLDDFEPPAALLQYGRQRDRGPRRAQPEPTSAMRSSTRFGRLTPARSPTSPRSTRPFGPPVRRCADAIARRDFGRGRSRRRAAAWTRSGAERIRRGGCRARAGRRSIDGRRAARERVVRRVRRERRTGFGAIAVGETGGVAVALVEPQAIARERARPRFVAGEPAGVPAAPQVRSARRYTDSTERRGTEVEVDIGRVLEHRVVAADRANTDRRNITADGSPKPWPFRSDRRTSSS